MEKNSDNYSFDFFVFEKAKIFGSEWAPFESSSEGL